MTGQAVGNIKPGMVEEYQFPIISHVAINTILSEVTSRLNRNMTINTPVRGIGKAALLVAITTGQLAVGSFQFKK